MCTRVFTFGLTKYQYNHSIKGEYIVNLKAIYRRVNVEFFIKGRVINSRVFSMVVLFQKVISKASMSGIEI